MGSELLTAHHDDNISQDVTAPEAIKVEKNVTGVARELDTAVSRGGHFVFTWKERGQNLVSSPNPIPAYQGCEDRGAAR